MLFVALICVFLIVLTTLIHYEVLKLLDNRLATLRLLERNKLLVVMFVAFAAHLVEIAIYGASLYALVEYGRFGTLQGSTQFSLLNCFYFSAETYTTLGFGDLTPAGPIRLLAGIESLNGLLLVGWTATVIYTTTQRIGTPGTGERT